MPDADVCATHGVLAAERAREGSVLGDFHLLDLLTQRGTVTGAVLACGDSYKAQHAGSTCQDAVIELRLQNTLRRWSWADYHTLRHIFKLKQETYQ